MSKTVQPAVRLSPGGVARFRRHVLVTTTCYVWMGAIGSDGYGRFSVRRPGGGERVVSPHHVAAALAFGPSPMGSTLLHDCELRLCCRTDGGHVRIGTQSENMRDAVRRGRAVGPRPGRVDVRGKVGASRAVQDALRQHGGQDPDGLAALLAAVVAEGDPLRDVPGLFDPPPVVRTVVPPPDFPVDLFDLVVAVEAGPPDAGDPWPLFDV